ncbi:MAG TPA: nuclear transport factor 2 family protein, partial [Stellaceae bacterium]|nr:nuclear transport factor 2 family protein [Stellaceae bacterium]
MNANEIEAIRQACMATIAGYTYFADSGVFDRAVTFFTPDGLWLRGGTPLNGREEIRKSLEGRKPGMIIRHIIGSAWVEPKNGDTADVVTTYMAYHAQG